MKFYIGVMIGFAAFCLINEAAFHTTFVRVSCKEGTQMWEPISEFRAYGFHCMNGNYVELETNPMTTLSLWHATYCAYKYDYTRKGCD